MTHFTNKKKAILYFSPSIFTKNRPVSKTCKHRHSNEIQDLSTVEHFIILSDDLLSCGSSDMLINILAIVYWGVTDILDE